MDALTSEQQRTNELLAAILKALETRPIEPVQRPVDSGQSKSEVRTVVIGGRTYDSPKLFTVIDWVALDPANRLTMTVRDISARVESDTGLSVSKSWVAIAKQYYKSRGG